MIQKCTIVYDVSKKKKNKENKKKKIQKSHTDVFLVIHCYRYTRNAKKIFFLNNLSALYINQKYKFLFSLVLKAVL